MMYSNVLEFEDLLVFLVCAFFIKSFRKKVLSLKTLFVKLRYSSVLLVYLAARPNYIRLK